MKHSHHEHAQDMECACEMEHAHEHDHESGCACGHEHTHSKEKPKSYLARIIVGAAIFALGILLQNTAEIPEWMRFVIFLAAYLVLGINVLITAGKNMVKGKVFDENFLMTVATVGAFILADYAEGTAVMLFYLIGETLSDLAVERSKKSIAKLMDIRPDYANLKQGDTVKRVDPQDVKIGDTIVVKPFEKIPLDGVILEGASALNTSALTGESMPREVFAGESALAGSVNGGGLLTIRVEKEFGESTVAKILDLVEHAGSKKAHTEKFITKFARYYTPVVCAGALVVAVIPSLVTGDVATWVYRALLFLVISCPCALVVSVPLTYFSGIGGASKKGILIKGANYLEALTNVQDVVFDKTGTLTKGVFAVKKITAADGITEEEVLENAAVAEANSSHPIAKSVLETYGRAAPAARDYREEAGYGVIAITEDGEEILAGNAKLLYRHNIAFSELEDAGTVLYVAHAGRFLGSILIADKIKQDARQTANALHALGVGTAMLTGDAKRIGETVAAEIGIDEVYTELLPQDKVAALEHIQEKNGSSAFVGDGINDAPVLARADVGIAMGGAGSDAAIEAADVVLMTDEPLKVAESIRLSRRTRRIVWQNIIFALAVKAGVMTLGITGIADMWWAVFADVGVTLIAVLNALRAMK